LADIPQRRTGEPGSAGETSNDGGAGPAVNAAGDGPTAGNANGMGGTSDSDGGAPNGGQPSMGGQSSTAGNSGASAVGGTNAVGGASSGGSSGGGGEGNSGGAGCYAAAGGPNDHSATDLISLNGDVSCTQNDFGIRGKWQLFAGTAETATADFSLAHICLDASIRQVPGVPDGTNWGALVGLSLNGGAAYDAVANHFAGVRFTINDHAPSGGGIPERLLIEFKHFGEVTDYCAVLVGATDGQVVTLNVGDARQNCNTDSNGAAVKATELERFDIHIPPLMTGPVTANFCVSDIRALPAASGSGGGAGVGGG